MNLMHMTFPCIDSSLIAINYGINTKIYSSFKINNNPLVCGKIRKWKNII